MRAPGGLERRDISRGSLLPQRFSPDPRWDARIYPESLAVDCVVPVTVSNYLLDGVSLPMAHLRGEALKSRISKRSIIIAGRKTSVSLEDEFWDSLKEIARERGMTLGALVAAIDANRQHTNLSSAIRLFVLGVYRDQRR